MKNITKALHEIIESYTMRLNNFSDDEFSNKPLPHQWSKKEVTGHLIDSAQNNLRRFVTAQYEATPPKIVYNQDFWVKASDYQNMNKADVIQLWRLLNLQICAVLKTLPLEHYSMLCDTGREQSDLHSLAWLAEDYVKHLKHHINQIIPASFDVIYP